MVILIAIVVGLAFGVGSTFANRLWGTLLAAAPVLAWFAFFSHALEGGLTGPETQVLGFGVCGIVVGLFLGQMLGRYRRKTGSVQQ